MSRPARERSAREAGSGMSLMLPLRVSVSFCEDEPGISSSERLMV